MKARKRDNVVLYFTVILFLFVMAVRVERFSDPDNGISGTSQKLTEATLTYEYRPVENLILKVEGRRDHSTALVFDRGVSGESKNQTIVVIGAVVTFGG